MWVAHELNDQAVFFRSVFYFFVRHADAVNIHAKLRIPQMMERFKLFLSLTTISKCILCSGFVIA